MSTSLTTGGAIAPIVPKSLDDAYKLADMCVKANMAPSSFKDDAAAVCVAVVTGMEIGIPPMQAIQGIAVINGRPTIWGDLAIAIVQASEVCEYIKEWIDGEVAYCEVKRKDREHSEIRTFSMEDANKANLANKAGPWKQYPKRMLQMRARSWALRDVFSDVLKGMRIREEEQDIIDVTPAPPSPPSPPAEIEDQSQEEPEFDQGEFLAQVESQMEKAKTLEELEVILEAASIDDETSYRVQEMYDLYEAKLHDQGPEQYDLEEAIKETAA